MEKMIRDIVDADREARLRLLEKQKEKDNIQSLIREERESIKAKYLQDAKERVRKKREELQAQLTRQEEIENKRYENTAAQLQQQFDGSRGRRGSASSSRIVLTPTERGKERREVYGQSQCHRGKGEKPAWRAA